MTERTIKKLLGVMCLAVMAGILGAGLWPFHAPRNEVTWIAGGNGLRFAYPGTIVSDAEFQAVAAPEAACSIEVWAQPSLLNDSNTLFAFHTAQYPRQLEIRQSLTDLKVIRNSPFGEWSFYVANAFRSLRPVFITIDSGPSGTAVYIDGILVRTVRGSRISGADCTGRLVVGTSPTGNDPWTGTLLGLAIYGRELTGAQVVSHYETWTHKGQPAVDPRDNCTALYLFNERDGRVIHNQAGPGPSLIIPETYRIEDQTFLMAFWKGFDPADIIENIAAFIPLGFLFCAYLSLGSVKRAAVIATVLGGLISLIIEVLQFHLPTRQSDSTDILTDTLGTWLGVILFRYAERSLAKQDCASQTALRRGR